MNLLGPDKDLKEIITQDKGVNIDKFLKTRMPREQKEVVYMDMERVGPKEAAAELHMDVVSLHHLMRQQRLPIGVAIKKEGKTRWSYYIYRNLLDKYKQTGGEQIASDKHN